MNPRREGRRTVLVEQELAVLKVHRDSDPVAHGVGLARMRRGVVVVQLTRGVVRPTEPTRLVRNKAILRNATLRCPPDTLNWRTRWQIVPRNSSC
jgi:hypothetical protein